MSHDHRGLRGGHGGGTARHPVLLMGIVTTLIVWQDPIMNWSPYAVYNPQLWHWPEDWPLVSLSPTVEPFLVIGYIMFYLGPFFPAVWILRKLQAQRPVDSFVWRHPLISLGAAHPAHRLRHRRDARGHARPHRASTSTRRSSRSARSFVGEPYQFPLIWESVMVTFVMIPAGVLLYRDDTGRTVAEKLAQRARVFVSRPAPWHVRGDVRDHQPRLLRVRHRVRDHQVDEDRDRRWPAHGRIPEAKVYDPQGFYEENGQPGPYFGRASGRRG